MRKLTERLRGEFFDKKTVLTAGKITVLLVAVVLWFRQIVY